jgi:hypothetical protein
VTVSSGIAANAFAMEGYLRLKSLLLRERRWTPPPFLNASAQKPSNFSSYENDSPVGSCGVGRRSMGSMKRATAALSDMTLPVSFI